MATAAQILANRENAANSTGPKTEAGKAAAAQNATTHGLSGAFRLLSGENPAEFEALVAALTAETPTEHFLVNEMARAQWKLDRVAAIEAEIFAAAEDPAALAADPMPDHLRREFDALRRRDPLFDPFRDRSQMSKHLQKWFDRTTMAA
jgi:hypothetical protein